MFSENTFLPAAYKKSGHRQATSQCFKLWGVRCRRLAWFAADSSSQFPLRGDSVHHALWFCSHFVWLLDPISQWSNGKNDHISKRTKLPIRVKYIEVCAVTFDGLTGGNVKVLNVFLIMKSWDCQTSEALWDVTDMLFHAMSTLGNSALETSWGPCKVLKKRQ